MNPSSPLCCNNPDPLGEKIKGAKNICKRVAGALGHDWTEGRNDQPEQKESQNDEAPRALGGQWGGVREQKGEMLWLVDPPLLTTRHPPPGSTRQEPLGACAVWYESCPLVLCDVTGGVSRGGFHLHSQQIPQWHNPGVSYGSQGWRKEAEVEMTNVERAARVSQKRL